MQIICIRKELLKPCNVCKLFVLDRNTWNHVIVCKQTNIKTNIKYDFKKLLQWNVENINFAKYIFLVYMGELSVMLCPGILEIFVSFDIIVLPYDWTPVFFLVADICKFSPRYWKLSPLGCSVTLSFHYITDQWPSSSVKPLSIKEYSICQFEFWRLFYLDKLTLDPVGYILFFVFVFVKENLF